MEQFKIGDRIQNMGTNLDERANGNRGKFGMVKNLMSMTSQEGEQYLFIKYDDGESGEGLARYYKLINKKTFMSRVSIMMKKLLDADTQKLVKAGYINGDLALTTEGRAALDSITFEANKTALVAMADEVIAEEEKANK